jgi:hypothetical protein
MLEGDENDGCEEENMSESIHETHQQQVRDRVETIAQQNREDLEAVVALISKMTHRSSEQVKPQLQILIANLVEIQEPPFHATATAPEWTRRFTEWVESHQGREYPYLSDEAISRESIYGDDR